MSYPIQINDLADRVKAWHEKATGIEGRATRAMGRKVLEEAAEFFAQPCPEEAADVIIVLLIIAGREGWNLEQALVNKICVLEARTDQIGRDRDRLLCPAQPAEHPHPEHLG